MFSLFFPATFFRSSDTLSAEMEGGLARSTQFDYSTGPGPGAGPATLQINVQSLTPMEANLRALHTGENENCQVGPDPVSQSRKH